MKLKTLIEGKEHADENGRYMYVREMSIYTNDPSDINVEEFELVKPDYYGLPTFQAVIADDERRADWIEYGRRTAKYITVASANMDDGTVFGSVCILSRAELPSDSSAFIEGNRLTKLAIEAMGNINDEYASEWNGD